jgi:hypothetical protein
MDHQPLTVCLRVAPRVYPAQADAVTTGREADLSDYRKNKINEGNVGYQVRTLPSLFFPLSL